MLKQIITVGCVIICATFALSRSAKNSRHPKKHRESRYFTNKTDDFLDEDEPELTEVSKFSDRTTLKMLEDITAKVWRTLPVVSVPQSWLLAYCVKFTEISEEVEKATMRCQYDGTDWDCTFIELGGGHDDFNMGKIVSLFHDLSNRGLRLKLLRAAEICGKLWQRYKQIQDKRIIRMRLNVQKVKDREKRLSKRNANSRSWRSEGRKLRKKKEEKRDEEVKKERRAAKKMKAIRQKLTNKIAELENKKTLNPDEETELNQLRLTMTEKRRANKLEDYSLAEERAELSRLRETGSCLSQQAAKACESVILDAVKKLM